MRDLVVFRAASISFCNHSECIARCENPQAMHTFQCGHCMCINCLTEAAPCLTCPLCRAPTFDDHCPRQLPCSVGTFYPTHLQCLRRIFYKEIHRERVMKREALRDYLTRSTTFLGSMLSAIEGLSNWKVTPNPEQPDDNHTLLGYCARKNQAPNCRTLIRYDADVNAVDGRGYTPLLEAVTAGHVDCVRLLLEAGATDDSMSLAKASREGHVECIRLLAHAGADVNRVVNKRTPLIEAAQNGRVGSIHALIEANANVNLVVDNKWTALIASCVNSQPDCTRALLQAKADPNLPLYSPAAAAAYAGCLECLHELMKTGRARFTQNTLRSAVELGNEGMYKYMLQQRGVKENLKPESFDDFIQGTKYLESRSRLPLHLIVRHYLDYGVDVRQLKTAADHFADTAPWSEDSKVQEVVENVRRRLRHHYGDDMRPTKARRIL